MLNLLEKSTSAINKIATVISASGLIIATICLFLQVIFRVISFTATWTGEIARYAFMVTVFYGMAAAIDRGLNLVITMFSDKLSEKKKFIYSIFTKVLFVFFFSIITNGVLRAANVASNNNQSFEAFTNVKISTLYYIIFVGLLITTFNSLLSVMKDICRIVSGKCEFHKN